MRMGEDSQLYYTSVLLVQIKKTKQMGMGIVYFYRHSGDFKFTILPELELYATEEHLVIICLHNQISNLA